MSGNKSYKDLIKETIIKTKEHIQDYEMKFNQRVILEYDKERYETTDRENDIRTNIKVMGEQLIQLAKNIKDNGELLRKYELTYFHITKVFRVDGMSSTSQADIIERGVKVMLGVQSIQISLNNQEISVIFDGTKTTTQDLINRINNLGFQANVQQK